MATWLENWLPEERSFWENTGKKIAWRTLWITTISLVLSFGSWFMMSAIVVKLPGIGFTFTENQLFWLAAMPGLAGGLLRILHTFLLPTVGTRHLVTFATLAKLIPVIGIGLAVMNTSTPFWLFMVLAFTAGFGGGDFSSFMPSTSVHFPKRLQGTALGIQAGIGNFGVSLAQFMTPLMFGLATYGSAQIFTGKVANEVTTKPIYVQSAAFWYAPLLIIMGFVAWRYLKSIPIKASFKEQLDIFRDKHTWFCTITYIMTFGSFSGLAAAFPMMIRSLYGGFEGAPDPLAYAFYGPLIGSASRVLFGFVADKLGGAVLTTVSGIGLIVGCSLLLGFGLVAPTSMAQFDLFIWVMLGMFFFTGIGNAATFRQFPIIFGANPRQAAGVIGWTAAVAAFGPFLFTLSIGNMINLSGTTPGEKSADIFFIGLIPVSIVATALNWYYYQRKGCERPS